VWQVTAAAVRTSDAPALANFLVQSVTRMIEVEGQRKAALDALMPPAVLQRTGSHALNPEGGRLAGQPGQG